VPRGLIPQTLMPLWTKQTFDDHVGGPGEEKHA
jgi:hypothetical protein